MTVGVELERLKPDARVRLPGQGEVVTLIRVASGPFWEFFYDGPSGTGKCFLAEAELAGIEVVDELDELRFDGMPAVGRREAQGTGGTLGATGMGGEPGFWAMARTLGELLPDGNRERTMLLGLTGNRAPVGGSSEIVGDH